MREIFRYGIKAEYSPDEITADLTRKGLSYRRQNMLEDIRRSYGYEASKTDAARSAFETWFETKYEPFRKAHPGQGAAVSRAIKVYQEGEIIPEELSDLVDEWEEVEEENPSPWQEV